MWRFADVLRPNSVLIVRVCWWFGRTETSRVISFGSAKPPAHTEGEDSVSSWNVRKPSHLNVVVCLRKFHCMLYVVWWWSIGTKTCSLLHSIYTVSQEECARLWEGVPYVKLYRYNPKHLCPKLNGYGDNGQWSLKLWQLWHTYWLPNTY